MLSWFAKSAPKQLAPAANNDNLADTSAHPSAVISVPAQANMSASGSAAATSGSQSARSPPQAIPAGGLSARDGSLGWAPADVPSVRDVPPLLRADSHTSDSSSSTSNTTFDRRFYDFNSAANSHGGPSLHLSDDDLLFAESVAPVPVFTAPSTEPSFEEQMKRAAEAHEAAQPKDPRAQRRPRAPRGCGVRFA